MNQKAEILISYFRDGMSMREIGRRLGIDKNTVSKYIKNHESKLATLSLEADEDIQKALIEEIVSSPKYDVSNRKKRKLTDEIKEVINNCLNQNKEKKLSGRAKQVMKKIDIHEYLVSLGHEIGYSTVCNYINEKSKEGKEAYIRQEYTLGETLKFDWGEVKLIIDGKRVSFDIGLFTTAAGSYHYARLYQNKKMENFLDIHVKAFAEIGGIHKEVVYDNMKQSVKKFVGSHEKEATEDLIKISMYYGFRYRFCNVRSGNEKGHVERGVEFVRRKAFSARDEFESIEHANAYLVEILEKLNSKTRKWLHNKSPKDVLEEEKAFLHKLMPIYDVSRKVEARVSKYSVITIAQNKYSVPDYLVDKFVSAKIYTDKIYILYKENIIAKHKRSYENHKWIIDINHFLRTLKKKPGAFHNSAGKHQMPPELTKIYQEYYTNNPKDFIVLLEIINEKGIKNIQDAIKTLSKMKKTLVTTENIKNIVNRGPTFQDNKNCVNEEITQASLSLIADITNIFDLEDKGGRLS